MMNSIKRFVREEDGVTMVEYGLLAALIAVVCIVAIQVIGTRTEYGVRRRSRTCLTPPLQLANRCNRAGLAPARFLSIR